MTDDLIALDTDHELAMQQNSETLHLVEHR